jgi:hypothetical protein
MALDTYQQPTLTNLLALLRIELNDGDSGAWSDADLTAFLNRAKLLTEVVLKCHRVSGAINLTTGTASYDLGAATPTPLAIFEPLSVSCGTKTLTKLSLAELGAANEGWYEADPGTPTSWAPMTGSTILLHPAPSATVTQALAHGYATTAAMTTGTDKVTSIPYGLSLGAMLAKAKELAYRSRCTNPTYVQFASEMAQEWGQLLGLARESLKSGAG